MSTQAATRPTNRTDQLFGGLNAEWAAAIAGQPVDWSNYSPELAGVRCPGDALDLLLEAGTDRTATDRILHALLMLGAGGDQLAHRTVLQAMLGVASKLQHTPRNWGPRPAGEAATEAIEHLWVAIATYPLHLDTHVSGNLMMRAWDGMLGRKAQRAARRQQMTPIDLEATREQEWSQAPIPGQTGPAAALEPAWCPDNPREKSAHELTELLTWAQHQGVLSDAEVQLIALRHFSDPDKVVPWNTIARTPGLGNCAAIRRRYSVAVRRLAAAVRDRY